MHFSCCSLLMKAHICLNGTWDANTITPYNDNAIGDIMVPLMS